MRTQVFCPIYKGLAQNATDLLYLCAYFTLVSL
jgi:hypothetical protein